MKRTCGGCTLCCKLVPVKELGKVAGERCRHQRHGKGCAIYDRRPVSCRAWSCAWLRDERTADLGRPDRTHYVIDQDLDFVTVVDNDTGAAKQMPVAQVWIDPRHPEAHRDPALRTYLDAIRLAALVRFGSTEGLILVPPSINSSGEWLERDSTMGEKEHSYRERAEVLSRLMP